MTVSRVAMYDKEFQQWVSAAAYVADHGDGQSVVNNPQHAITMAKHLSDRFGLNFRAENQVTDANGKKSWVPAQVTGRSARAAARAGNVRQA
jgi:hypothetical protein